MTYVARTPTLPASTSRVSSAPIFDYAPAGRIIAGVRVTGAPDYGIGFMGGHGEDGVWIPEDVAVPVRVENAAAINVLADPPGSMNGQGEAAFWFGNTVRANGLWARNSRIGIWTGSLCTSSVIRNANIDVRTQPGSVGLYAEHDTDVLVVAQSTIRADGNAINAEWWYAGHGSRYLILEDCTIESVNGWCVFLDAGTYGCLIRRCTLIGRNGIAHPVNLAASGRPNLIDWATITLQLSGTPELAHRNVVGAMASHAQAAPRTRIHTPYNKQSATLALHAARAA